MLKVHLAPPNAAKSRTFRRLTKDAALCRTCDRMADSVAVLSDNNGSLQSRVLFVAEAPGRLGAARTGIPLSGDQTGRNFERLLSAAGLSRDHVFVTNAVLCNPRDDRGRNATPSSAEVRNCARYLARTIAIVDPPAVVSLGAVALRALGEIEAHGLMLRQDCGRPVGWNGRVLVPLYHPGVRAWIHRPFEQQLSDFVALRSTVLSYVEG